MPDCCTISISMPKGMWFRWIVMNMKRKTVLILAIGVILLYILLQLHGHSRFGPIREPLVPPRHRTMLDDIADNLHVRYVVKHNFVCVVNIILTNVGDKAIKPAKWSIYFYNLRLIEPSLHPYPGGLLMSKSGMRIYHRTGSLYEMKPDPQYFKQIEPKKSITIEFTTSDFMVSMTDVFPNWYVYKEGLDPVIIKNTLGEKLDFVDKFEKSDQYRRNPSDKYHPLSVEERYDANADVKNLGGAANRLIPTPFDMTIDENNVVLISPSTWTVVKSDEFIPEVNFALMHFHLQIATSTPKENYIKFKKEKISLLENDMGTSTEAYSLKVDTSSKCVEISASTGAGAFYALKSLIAVGKSVTGGLQVPELLIRDEPRFWYRGFQLDVGRNFHSKEDILKLLDVMAMYKMNKFHFHLTDDEGWRLEIPGLEELTQLGSIRCHDETEMVCLKPQLGSGPYSSEPGTGYYSVSDYKEILRHASQLHIQVIPEFDLPGHARAAIKSMELRYHRKKNQNVTAATEYMLSDLSDNSDYRSVQYYPDNAVNPCIESTYAFIRHLIKSIKEIHKDIQPLTFYHYGGDEVPKGAWQQSFACKELLKSNKQLRDLTELKRYFVKRVISILDSEGLNCGAWEDGLMNSDKQHFQRSEFSTKRNIYGYAWNNVWEWNRAHVAYNLANDGYKVILAHATHLYFDHPYEADPKERGFYWATRTLTTRKVFNYLPDDLFGNAELTIYGDPISLSTICGGSCVRLNKPKNIAGNLCETSKMCDIIQIYQHYNPKLF